MTSTQGCPPGPGTAATRELLLPSPVAVGAGELPGRQGGLRRAQRILTDGDPVGGVVRGDHVEVGGVGVVGQRPVEQGHPGQRGVAGFDQPVKPGGVQVPAGGPHPGLRARPGGLGGHDRLQQLTAAGLVERPALVDVVVVGLPAVQRVPGGRVRAQRGAVDEGQPLRAGGLPAGADQRPEQPAHDGVGQLAVLVPGVLPGLRGGPQPPARGGQRPLHRLRLHQRAFARLPGHRHDE
jgi:hypothetical protein